MTEVQPPQNQAVCPRIQRDRTINQFGHELINLCHICKLLILNGRFADKSCPNTCYSANGSSLVDYGIISYHLYSTVSCFKVKPLTVYSDHCPIQLSLKVDIPAKCQTNSVLSNAKNFDMCSEVIHDYSQRTDQHPSNNSTNSYIVWNEGSIDHFISILRETSVPKLPSNPTKCTIDSSIEEFTNSIMKCAFDAGYASLRECRRDTAKKAKYQTNRTILPYRWFDEECQSLKRELQNRLKDWHLFSNDSIQSVTLSSKPNDCGKC